MRHSPPVLRARLIVGLAVLTALSTMTFGLVGESQAVGVDVHTEEESACSAIIDSWGSSLNSTYFREACAEPAFQQAFDQWGLSNFTIGSGGGPGWTDTYYEFDWVGACTNASLARLGPQCAMQEDWVANLTSDTLSGPTVHEGPLFCACGPSPAPTASWLPTVSLASGLPATVVIFAGFATFGSVIVVIVLSRKSRRPPPSQPPTM